MSFWGGWGGGEHLGLEASRKDDEPSEPVSWKRYGLSMKGDEGEERGRGRRRKRKQDKNSEGMRINLDHLKLI